MHYLYIADKAQRDIVSSLSAEIQHRILCQVIDRESPYVDRTRAALERRYQIRKYRLDWDCMQAVSLYRPGCIDVPDWHDD